MLKDTEALQELRPGPRMCDVGPPGSGSGWKPGSPPRPILRWRQPAGTRAQSHTHAHTHASPLTRMHIQVFVPDLPHAHRAHCGPPAALELSQAFSHILRKTVARAGWGPGWPSRAPPDGGWVSQAASSSEMHPPRWGEARPVGSRPGPCGCFSYSHGHRMLLAEGEADGTQMGMG